MKKSRLRLFAVLTMLLGIAIPAKRAFAIDDIKMDYSGGTELKNVISNPSHGLDLVSDDGYKQLVNSGGRGVEANGWKTGYYKKGNDDECKEISYFTIFSIQKYAECDTLGEAVIECLNNVGEIKSIDLDEGGNAIECWVTTGDESTCLYLFPYDDGIVSVKE